VANTPNTVRQQVQFLRHELTSLIHTMRRRLDGTHDFSITYNLPDLTELIIVDEADRLKMTSLEQLRDLYDRSALGLVLIGMPGIEKRLARYPQLYSRVGFVHHFKPLSSEEMHFILQHKWQQLGLQLNLDDFTDVEAVAAITRITSGNFRVLQRLFSQIDRILEINQLRLLTKEVVESARELLVIGPT
jgi:DNA transposition AAA+ family ATPase